MRAVRVTSKNVDHIMLNLGITSDMLMSKPLFNLCKLAKSKLRCNGECEKYGLGACIDSIGLGRGGACILYRLYNIVNGRQRDDLLFAPEHLIESECEDI